MTRLSVEEMMTKFQELAKATFRHRRDGRLWSYIDPASITSKLFLLFRIWESLYRTRPLRDGLIKLFGPNERLFSSSPITWQQRSTRVAVTSSSDGSAWIISNYSRPTLTEDPGVPERAGTSVDGINVGFARFEREDEQDKEIKTWEA